MNDNESAKIDPRTTPMYRSAPERIGLAFGDEDGLWQIEFDDCNGVTWYESDWHKNYAPVSVAIEYVRLDVYENLKVEFDSFADDVERSNRKNLSFATVCVRDEEGITVGGALNRQREMIAEIRAKLELQTQIAADANAKLNEAETKNIRLHDLLASCRNNDGYLVSVGAFDDVCAERDAANERADELQAVVDAARRPWADVVSYIVRDICELDVPPSNHPRCVIVDIDDVTAILHAAAPVLSQPAVVPEGLANAVLANIAAIAHCGGLAKLDNENALSNIRQLSKPWCDNTGTLRDLKNRVDAAILSATDTEVKNGNP